MALSQAEFEGILNDKSKTIQGDIFWKEESLWLKFKAEVQTNSGNYQLSVRGTYNSIVEALSYHIICPPYGRIYGLDLGKDHRNPDGKLVGEKHKHRWSELYRDKQAYVPPDITASAAEPVKVWQQFCREAALCHNGVMQPLPQNQLDLFL